MKMEINNETLAERIKSARKVKNLTQQALAKKSGIKQTTISKLEAGYIKSTASLVSLAKALQCSVIWLDSGRGDPWALEADIKQTLITDIPILGIVDLDDKQLSFTDIRKLAPYSESIQYLTKDINAYALKCVSDEMSPRIKQGEYIVVEPTHDEFNGGEEVLIKDKQGRVMVKQFAYKDKQNRKYFFSSINGNSAPFSIPEDKIDTMHYIAGYTKNN